MIFWGTHWRESAPLVICLKKGHSFERVLIEEKGLIRENRVKGLKDWQK